MTETIPQGVVDRLEHEWRMIDRSRPPPSPKYRSEEPVAFSSLKDARSVDDRPAGR